MQQGIAGALTRGELDHLRIGLLNETIAHARAHSRFYRSQLPSRRLLRLDDLVTLPLMGPTDLSAGIGPLLCVGQDEVSRLVTLPTSATTGTPKRVAFTPADHAATVDYFAAGMRMLAGAGEAIAILYPCERPGGLGDLLAQAIRQAGSTPLALGLPTGFPELADALAGHKAQGIVGFPQHVFAFARWCEHVGVSLDVKGVLLSADTIAPSLRGEVERIWGAAVFGHFGMTETGYGGAVECPHHTGYHVRESELVFEVIDPCTGALAHLGSWGELVVTTLTRRAMPLVRYRTGDMTRLISGRCACGSLLVRIDAVKGRLDEQIACHGRRFGMYELEDCLFKLPGVVDFHASYDAAQCLLSLVLAVLPGHALSAQDVRVALGEGLGQLVVSGALGVEADIRQFSAFRPWYPAKRSILPARAAARC
ncbi:MAG: hypothetical protein LBD25_08340 [Coriobacteriales bacterium]|nr:hypothetical protein [Coriobacteriales bacterium]